MWPMLPDLATNTFSVANFHGENSNIEEMEQKKLMVP